MGNCINFPKAYQFLEESLTTSNTGPNVMNHKYSFLKNESTVVQGRQELSKHLLRVRVQQYHKFIKKGLWKPMTISSSS